MKTVLVRFAVSTTAFLVVGIGVTRQPPMESYLVATAVAAGMIALVAAVGLLTAFSVARVDKLTISERGVKYGHRFWGWTSVRAFRARRSRPSDPIRLLIWKDADEGPGYFLMIDNPLSLEAAVELIRHVQEYCSTTHPEIKCEASC
jgi:hypothetical protein